MDRKQLLIIVCSTRLSWNKYGLSEIRFVPYIVWKYIPFCGVVFLPRGFVYWSSSWRGGLLKGNESRNVTYLISIARGTAWVGFEFVQSGSRVKTKMESNLDAIRQIDVCTKYIYPPFEHLHSGLVNRNSLIENPDINRTFRFVYVRFNSYSRSP